MDQKLKKHLEDLWHTYFKNIDLPITVSLTNDISNAGMVAKSTKWSCLVCELAKVSKGHSIAYNEESLGCGGAKRYLGYAENIRPHFEYFLSYGLEGVIEGERYKKSPEIVKETQNILQSLPAKGKYFVFKRWDKLEEGDTPDVVIFFAKGPVLSGLFTLANFDTVDPNGGVIAPFGGGCGTIIHYPYLEKDKENPRAVLGMFDPSAQPCVPKDSLSFAVPINKFEKMVSYMEESFLITDTWSKVMKQF
jgi:hypothetical protein